LITGRGKMLGTGITVSAEVERKENTTKEKQTEKNNETAGMNPGQSKGLGELKTAGFPVTHPAPIERIIFFYIDRSFSEYYPDTGTLSNRGTR
jgi:hypothetical protein